MGEQNPTPPAAPKSLDPEREERTNATTKTNCDEKFLPRYLMPLQGSRHDLCKTQRKMDTVSSLTFLTSNENILSRYLVPPQGSCHDTCKYGHKHEGEEASRKHSFSRVFGNNQNEEHDQLNFVSVKHRQKTDFTSVLNQKLEIKSQIGQTKEQISDKFKLNEEMDLPPDKIILTFNPTLNLAGLELSSPINEQKTIASLDNSAAAKVDGSIENGIDRHELVNTETVLVHTPVAVELEGTAIQSEFSFHNDALIAEVGELPKKLIGLKSKVSSTVKGNTEFEHERANPPEIFSVETTPIADDTVPGECQTPNGEKESYNKLIGSKETVHRSSKEPLSLKSKNYKSKQSAKQIPAREELASKQALGIKLKTPLELERTAIQNEFSFHNDAVITEVGKSAKKHIDLKSMVSSTAGGKTDSEYERANPSEVFSVEHTSMELIPPTPFTDDIAPGECQTSNREEVSYNKPIDNMMESVHRSSKEPSSLKSKNYKSKESAKKKSSREELTSKRALSMKLKTPLKLERTAIQNEFSFHNDAVIAEVGKPAKKLIDLKSMVSSTAKGKTDSEYESANPSEVFSVEHTRMELAHPTPFTDDIVPGECQTSNGEEESYNKPIHSMIGTVDRSSKDTSSLRLKSCKSKESVKQRPIREELESKQALGMKLKTPTELERTAIQNEFSFHNDATIAEVDESPKKLFAFVVSSTVEGNTDSAYERGNPSEAFSVEHTSMEFIPPTPITDGIVPGECLTSIGEEESYSKLISSKMETVHQSSKGPSNLKFKKCTSKESAKQRASLEELASKRALGVRLKAPLIQKTHAFNISTPQPSFSLKHIHLKSLSIHDKKKRELNKPKIRIKEVGDTRKHKVVELQRYASNGPNIAKVNSALKKAIKVARLENDHDNPTIACGEVAFVAPKVIIDSVSPPFKSNSKTTKAVACFRKKKVLETSSPPSIYSKGVPGQRKQEKEKIIKVADNLQNIAKEVIEPLSTPSSSKPRFTRVPSFKLRKNMTIAPSFTMNNQAIARKIFVKGKNTRANEPNLEKIDLKALRQKLRKLGSFSDRKKEHATSGSQRSGGNEPFWLNEVSQARRTFGDVHKVERRSRSRSRSRRVSFDSEDKVGSSLKLNFSRGKIANLQPNSSSPPAWLTFGRAKTVGDYQNAKISPTKSFRSWMKSDVGGTSTSPSKSIKVILRHKHADDKKVEKNLLNHVIEETASKLVESRKSKVKALVGAFETVISLQ